MLKLLVVEDHALVREGLLATLKKPRRGNQDLRRGRRQCGDRRAGGRGHRHDDPRPDAAGDQGADIPAIGAAALSDRSGGHSVGAGRCRYGIACNEGRGIRLCFQVGLQHRICWMPSARCCRATSTCRPKLQELVNRSDVAQGDGKALVQRFGLTQAQARVLELLAEGRSNRQIGELLGLTEGTVKIHASAIMKAMGVSNRSEAALMVTRRRRQN
jgi:DNA-binding CsgD family transcriptional regulator